MSVIDIALMRLRRPSGRLRTTAVIIEGENNTFLGVSRKNDYDSWGLPGGKSEEGEFITACACRELEEETGLTALHMDLMDVRDYDNTLVTPVSYDEVWLYKVTKYSGTIFSNEELMSKGEGLVKWITVDELANGAFWDYNKAILEEYYGL